MASEMQRVKKAKWVTPGEDREASESPLSAELADQSKRDRLREAYATALPWPHVVVDSLCRPDVMRVIRDEILELEATYKETDIFKVYQVSQDLRSLNHRRDTLPQLLALRDAVYSPSFRDFVSEVTGCGPLTDQVDCSANFYTQGCHLLCHDDTIGTRRISYIIYFTDPDKEWKHEDGGCFELYAREDTTGVPSTRILPSFNSMCMFRVVPGESFHSVQEVYTNDNTRISIQGWFHAAEEPEHKERASRLLLQSTEHSVVLQQSAVLGPFIRLVADPGENIEAEEDEDALLSPADVQELGAWINPTYLKPGSIAQIREHFTTQSTIQLQQFLTSDLASSIRDLTGRADQEDRGYGDKRGSGAGPCEYGAGGARAGWKAVGPPPLRHYLRWEAEEAAEGSVKPSSGAVGPVIGEVAHVRMRSPAFRRFLLALTGMRCLATRAQVRRFRPGLDYTCANPSALTLAHRLDATLCLVQDTGAVAAEQWASGDVGGFQAYLPSAQEDNPDEAAVYRADGDDGGLLQVPASNNTLNLVLHDPGTHKFVKYVASNAPGSRWDVAAEYEVSPEDVGGGSDEGDEGDE